MYTFRKQERLCSKKSIDALFQSGQRMMAFPYSVHWMLCPVDELPEGGFAQVLVTTSKKTQPRETAHPRMLPQAKRGSLHVPPREGCSPAAGCQLHPSRNIPLRRVLPQDGETPRRTD